ncbi:lipase family protein [Nocardia sp. NPDC003693]
MTLHRTKFNRRAAVAATFATICVSVAGLCAMAPGAAADPVATAPSPPLPPQSDPFYSPPADLVAATAPGDIIAARSIQPAAFTVLPLAIDAWQLSFRSNDSHGNPIAAVTTVLKPRGAASEPRKLFSYQLAEDSTGRNCAPSYAIQAGADLTAVTSAAVHGETAFVYAALARGWAVSLPDHQGPNEAMAVGPLGGHITLDAIRAAEHFEPLETAGTATKVALMGYSGGSFPTVFAAELHDRYAPELDIVGTAAGGTGPDLQAGLIAGNGQLGAGFGPAILIGVAREYPEYAQLLDEHLNPAGKAVFDFKRDLCVGLQIPTVPFLNTAWFTDSTGILTGPVADAVFAQLRAGSSVPHTPMFIYHANPDWLAPVGPVNDLVDTYCQDPAAQVQYTRDHFSEHATLYLTGAPTALMWLADRLDGIPAPAGCHTTDVGSMALSPQAWEGFTAIVGDSVAALFGAPLGR